MADVSITYGVRCRTRFWGGNFRRDIRGAARLDWSGVSTERILRRWEAYLFPIRITPLCRPMHRARSRTHIPFTTYFSMLTGHDFSAGVENDFTVRVS